MLLISKSMQEAFNKGQVVVATLFVGGMPKIVDVIKTEKGFDIVKVDSKRIAPEINFELTPVTGVRLNATETLKALAVYAYNCGETAFKTLDEKALAAFNAGVKDGDIEVHENGENGSKSACYYVYRDRARKDFQNTGNKYLIAIHPKNNKGDNKHYLGMDINQYLCVGTLQGATQKVEIKESFEDKAISFIEG